MYCIDDAPKMMNIVVDLTGLGVLCFRELEGKEIKHKIERKL